MAEQHPEPTANVPPTPAPPGFLPPPAAPAPAPAGPSFAAPQTAPVTGYVPPAAAPAAPPSAAPTAYQAPVSAPAPTAYQAPASAPAYQAPASAPAPTAYPTPGAYQAPSAAAPSAPPAAAAEPWNAPPTTPVTEWTQPEDDTEEKVGRGMLFAFGGVIAGIVLAVFLWQMGFVAALTGAVMAYACVWLYGKGAGRAPRKGAIGLLLLILVGVVVSLVAAIASDAVLVARKVFPNNTARQTEAVISYITTPEVWMGNGTSVAMYLIFAALGCYGIFIGLAKARKAG